MFTTTAAVASSPFTVLIGPPTAAPARDITSKIDRDSLQIEETGNHDAAHCDFEFIDLTLANTAIRGRWNILVTYESKTLFRGIMGTVRPEIRARYANHNVSARDIGSVLDDQIVKTYGSNGGPIKRTTDESDRARIAWLFDLLGPTGPIALDPAAKVQVLNASMPNQSFPPRLSLRQCIERVLGAASDSANYYVDSSGRLHTFDDDHPEASVDAPYDVVVGTPTAGEIAPHDLQIEWDDRNYFNGYFVRAHTKGLSGFYTDAHPDLAMEEPYGAQLFGNRFTYLDAPDADTAAKVRRVVKAALRDTRNPIPRGTFSVRGAQCFNGSVRWTSGQKVYVESPQHGLNGNPSGGGSADDGPWAGGRPLQPLRVVRNTITLLDGGDNLNMDIEIGGRQTHLYQPGSAS